MENYEQKHKDDLEAAKGWLAIAKENNNKIAIQILEKFFPELRESDDERIRKALLEYFGEQCDMSNWNSVYGYEVYAWLEKQKCNKPIKFSEEDEKTRLWIVHVLCECGYKFNDNGERENAFELLEKIKQIIYSSSLEKQGEQDDYNPYKATVESIAAMVEKYANDGDLSDFYSNVAVKCHDAMEYEEMWRKQGGQKPYDKVEPKFKVGDWIYHEISENTIHINKIENGLYTSDEGTTISFGRQDDWRLWTIQDAKDGDVLSSGNPFIFSGFGDKKHPNNPTAYCGINSEGTFILSVENDWWTANDVHPTTKEQCDLLFQKMKEAGYEWDAEKKELKNIEKKPIDKVEPKFKVGDTLKAKGTEHTFIVDRIQDGFYHCDHNHCALFPIEEQDNWELIEHKSAWGEDDEKMLVLCASSVRTRYNDGLLTTEEYERASLWLKSLKPQPRWKPSEEQMQALFEAKLASIKNREYFLGTLYDNLKNL